MTLKATPIAIFAYKRPEHLKRTLQDLSECHNFSDFPVTIYCDGPKNPEDRDSVAATREVAKLILGKGATYRFSEENIGLARSIIGGVTEQTELYGRTIVIEDDFRIAPNFLNYMRDAIDRYESEQSVMQISGYMFDVPELSASNEPLFLPFISTWGWATWQRAWTGFRLDTPGWEELFRDPRLRHRFNLSGAYDYASMLRRQIEGKRDSWGVRFYWHVFKANGVVLYPPQTLIKNTGQDGSGSHGSGQLRSFSNHALGFYERTIRMPPSPAIVEPINLQNVTKAIRRQNGGLLGSTADTIKRILRI